MKKIFVTIALSAAASFAFAQDNTLVSKNGTPILPEAKDWGLGFDAAPFFDVIKGLFSSNDSTGSGYAQFTRNNPLIIYGKYVKDVSTFYRVAARLNFGSIKENFVTLLDSSSGTPTSTVKYGNDVGTQTDAGIYLAFGIEKRKGKGRVQGYYGPEAGIGYSTRKVTFNYANAFSAENPVPSISPPLVMEPAGYRIAEQKSGSLFGIGIRGFIGVEYFFMAKASLGAEFGWGVRYVHQGEPVTKHEHWDPSLNSGSGGVNTITQPGDISNIGKVSNFIFDTDNANAALNLLFYF